MTALKRKDVQAAKRRGLVDGDLATAAAPRRGARYCPMTGRQFVPYSEGHKGFVCTCAAYRWGEMLDNGVLDRRVWKGVSVVLYDTGERATVVSVASAEQASVLTDDGQERTVAPKDIERIQYQDIEHFPSCGRRGLPTNGDGTDTA